MSAPREGGEGARPKSSRPPVRIAHPDERPEIIISSETHRTTADMIKALRVDPDLYQRSCELVHVITSVDEEPDALHAPATPLVRACPLSWVVDRVSEFAVCKTITKKGDAKKVAPPKPRVQAVVERGSWSGIRTLDSVVEAPSIRPDGSILQTPGYDRVTRALFIPNAAFLSIPDRPTHADAVLAYSHIAEEFKHFPYVDPSHRSATIAAILTLLARPAILGSVPAWIFDASSPRSGKSLQMDAVSIIATGRKASRCTFPTEDDELEKILAAYALAGARLIPFDNIDRPFGGAALDKVITATDTVDFRILGRTEQKTLAWRAVVLASGNNVPLSGDILPRVLAPRLESLLENPEQRAGLPDLRAACLANRPRLVRDALTILRAWFVAGRPRPADCKPWGGFEQWSALIPPALVWVGAPDPMGARRGMQGDEDPTRAAEVAIVAGWGRLCDSVHAATGLTVSGALAKLYPPPRQDDPPDGFDDLREAIEHLTNASPGKTPSSRRVGDALRRLKNRPSGGRRLFAEATTGGIARWRSLPIATTPPPPPPRRP